MSIGHIFYKRSCVYKLILSKNKWSYGLFKLCGYISIFTYNIAIITLKE